MREIRFRGKRVDNGEWVFGWVSFQHNRAFIHSDDMPYDNAVEVDPATVGQFTGLKDKSGREIYEGDIVEVNYTVKYIDPDKQDEEHAAITRVYWNDFRASFALEFHKFANDDLYRFVRDKYAEVVGNAHDNPELLEGSA